MEREKQRIQTDIPEVASKFSITSHYSINLVKLFLHSVSLTKLCMFTVETMSINMKLILMLALLYDDYTILWCPVDFCA